MDLVPGAVSDTAIEDTSVQTVMTKVVKRRGLGWPKHVARSPDGPCMGRAEIATMSFSSSKNTGTQR